MKKPASLVAAIFLFCIATVQFIRAVFGVTATAGGFEIPVWWSFFAAAFLAALGIWLLKERRS